MTTKQERPISELKNDPKNPREIKAPAAAGLDRSMQRFGDIATIVWNRGTGELVAGHQRMKRLVEAGAKVWTRDDDTTGYIEDPRTKERFKIRIVDWDKKKQRLANIVANNQELHGDFTADVIDQIEKLVDDEAAEELMLRALEATEAARLREDDWESDIAATTGNERMDGIAGKIVVTCPSSRREAVKAKVVAAVKGMRGVEVE